MSCGALIFWPWSPVLTISPGPRDEGQTWERITATAVSVGQSSITITVDPEPLHRLSDSLREAVATAATLAPAVRAAGEQAAEAIRSGIQAAAEAEWERRTFEALTGQRETNEWVNGLYVDQSGNLYIGGDFVNLAGPSSQERQAAQQEADTRARSLLLSCLTPEQEQEFIAHSRFTVTAPSGNRYRIHAGTQYNVQRLNEAGNGVEYLCAGPTGNVPLWDWMLAQKLMLEADEGAFLKKANRRDTEGWSISIGTYQGSEEVIGQWRGNDRP